MTASAPAIAADPLGWLPPAVRRKQADGLWRTAEVFEPLPGGRCLAGGREGWNFASNDYLGLAEHPAVVAAAQEAAAAGFGSRASAAVTGRSAAHDRLERRIARFKHAEAALLFPTGHAANAGTIPALVGRGDAVFCDRLNHASLVAGCRLSQARLRVFRGNEPAGLDRLARDLEQTDPDSRRLIATDAVFSMDGHLAPLPELCDLAERFGAMLLVDEAHGTGVFGATGRGVGEHFGVSTASEDRVSVQVGTLSKAIGGLGGYVAGPRRLIDWLRNSAGTQMFSTALPPACCAAAEAALEIIDAEPGRRETLWRLSNRLRARLEAAGLTLPAGSVGPIVPVVVGDPDRTMQAARELRDAGFVVGAIRPPTVPAGTSRLRITLSAIHAVEAVDRLADAVVASLGGPR